MCGIVGYIGYRSPKDIIITGLKKLEYRGYDSAGITVYHQNVFKRIRAEGKLLNLETKLENEIFEGPIGIGHTRWATHGSPCEANAHPHFVDGISIVHNGIIENYQELKNDLMKEGLSFSSDTDSEVIAHLLAKEIKITNDIFKAARNIISLLKGAYSILTVWDKAPDQIVAFKNGPPLILGLAENERFIASDIQAIIPYTDKIIYLDDHEIALVKKNEHQIFSANGFIINKKIDIIDWNLEQAEKKGYPHYMLKEIYEQPLAVAAAIDPHINRENHCVELNNLIGCDTSNLGENFSDKNFSKDFFRQFERIFIVACGTSFYASMYGKYLLEGISKIPTEIDIASEFRYRSPVIPDKSLIITISQSGETADTLATLRIAKEKGAKVLSICNVKNSTIDRLADVHLYMNSGPEIGVASTKAFVSTLCLLNLLALHLAKVKDCLSLQEEKLHVESLLALPSQIEQVLFYDNFLFETAETLKHFRGFLYMGRGVNYPVAMEGALKLKELAYMHAEGYAAGEMKHGPLALIDDRMIVVMIAPFDQLYDKTLSNLEEAKARGAQIISIGTEQNEKLKNLSLHYISIPKTNWALNPILAVVPLQLLAYHLADSLGYDVDQPRNLAKSVTVE